MPGSFNSPLQITAGRIAPNGPLVLAAGEIVLRVDIWIFQRNFNGRGGAFMDFLLSPPGPNWAIAPGPANHFGMKFRPGWATGKGLMISRINGRPFVFHWSRDIELQ